MRQSETSDSASRIAAARRRYKMKNSGISFDNSKVDVSGVDDIRAETRMRIPKNLFRSSMSVLPPPRRRRKR